MAYAVYGLPFVFAEPVLEDPGAVVDEATILRWVEATASRRAAGMEVVYQVDVDMSRCTLATLKAIDFAVGRLWEVSRGVACGARKS